MGLLVSFAANVTYPKAQNLRDIARDLPWDDLLTEPIRPTSPRSPCAESETSRRHVAAVAKTLGPVRDLAPVEFAAATTDNFRRFFRLARRAGG